MNRREFLNAATVAMGSTVLARAKSTGGRGILERTSAESSPQTFPRVVAGIHLPDSAIAQAATKFSRNASPEYLFNHCVRSFLFGSFMGKSLGLSFDSEVLYLACILHDLGLTESYEGPLPFEIQGAEAAKKFLGGHGYPAQRLDIVWDGIAMHPSMIAEFKQPEIKLVAEGVGMDVVGPEGSEITTTEMDEVLKAFPRLQFKKAFLKSCADVVRKHPGGATRSFMRDVGERYVPEFHPRNFCDVALNAPFTE